MSHTMVANEDVQPPRSSPEPRRPQGLNEMTPRDEFRVHQAALQAEARARHAVEAAVDELGALAGRNACEFPDATEESVQEAMARLATARADLERRHLAVAFTRELPSIRGRR
jgi:hypothetical protein